MNAIAAVDRNWAIGREGGLLFHLPTDMKHFRDLTVGGTVILGRKTLETFPGGKPLKDRRNIVITRNSDFTRDGCDIVGCYDQALGLTVDPEDDDVLSPVVALQDLVRDTEQGAGYIGRSEDLLALDRCAQGA